MQKRNYDINLKSTQVLGFVFGVYLTIPFWYLALGRL